MASELLHSFAKNEISKVAMSALWRATGPMSSHFQTWLRRYLPAENGVTRGCHARWHRGGDAERH
jgi:hypothetical protein